MISKRSGKSLASQATKALNSSSSSAIQKSLAASVHSQRSAGKQTGSVMARHPESFRVANILNRPRALQIVFFPNQMKNVKSKRLHSFKWSLLLFIIL